MLSDSSRPKEGELVRPTAQAGVVKLSELRTEAEIHEQDMHDVDYRREAERTQFGNDIAIKVIHYQVSLHMSQAELARVIGMGQPNIARPESGEHEPSLSTRAWLSSVLGVDLSVNVRFLADEGDRRSARGNALLPGLVNVAPGHGAWK